MVVLFFCSNIFFDFEAAKTAFFLLSKIGLFQVYSKFSASGIIKSLNVLLHPSIGLLANLLFSVIRINELMIIFFNGIDSIQTLVFSSRLLERILMASVVLIYDQCITISVVDLQKRFINRNNFRQRKRSDIQILKIHIVDSSIRNTVSSGYVCSCYMYVFHLTQNLIEIDIRRLFVFADEVKLVVEVKTALRICTSSSSL